MPSIWIYFCHTQHWLCLRRISNNSDFESSTTRQFRFGTDTQQKDMEQEFGQNEAPQNRFIVGLMLTVENCHLKTKNSFPRHARHGHPTHFPEVVLGEAF